MTSPLPAAGDLIADETSAIVSEVLAAYGAKVQHAEATILELQRALERAEQAVGQDATVLQQKHQDIVTGALALIADASRLSAENNRLRLDLSARSAALLECHRQLGLVTDQVRRETLQEVENVLALNELRLRLDTLHQSASAVVDTMSQARC